MLKSVTTSLFLVLFQTIYTVIFDIEPDVINKRKPVSLFVINLQFIYDTSTIYI